jgi:hypothetical protein
MMLYIDTLHLQCTISRARDYIASFTDSSTRLFTIITIITHHTITTIITLTSHLHRTIYHN